MSKVFAKTQEDKLLQEVSFALSHAHELQRSLDDIHRMSKEMYDRPGFKVQDPACRDLIHIAAVVDLNETAVGGIRKHLAESQPRLKEILKILPQ